MRIARHVDKAAISVARKDISRTCVVGTRLSPRLALDDSQLVTLKLESGYYLWFQPDTGAQCNVVPFVSVQEGDQRF